MTIYTYNLATWEVKEEEVDEICSPFKAVRRRDEKGKLKDGNNNVTFNRFEETKEKAEAAVRDALRKEIIKRLKRLNNLTERHAELEKDSLLRFVKQPVSV